MLAAIGLVFTEGHTATSGDALVRTDLSQEAIRLGRVLVDLMPDEPEAVGLLALMLLTDARRPARTAIDGSLVRLTDQDRPAGTATSIAEGHALVRACLRRNRPGPFQIQAAIAAVHADAPTAEATDWHQIVALYDLLLVHRPERGGGDQPGDRGRRAAMAPTPVYRARRRSTPTSLDEYQPFHAARADLLARAGTSTTPSGVRPRHRADHQPDRAPLPAFSAQQGRSALVELNIRNDVGHVSLDHEVHTLDEAACRSLIASGGLGRVAVTDRALPMILPVAFACLGADIAVRLAPGVLDRAADAGQVVCFQTDSTDRSDRGIAAEWSVEAIGQLRRVDDPQRSRVVPPAQRVGPIRRPVRRAHAAAVQRPLAHTLNPRTLNRGPMRR